VIVSTDAAYWTSQLNLPLIDRLGIAPNELLLHVASVNMLASNGDTPEHVVLPPDFVADVRAAIAEIPPIILKLLDKPLLGVYFARGLGSSAITDIVFSADGKMLGAVTLLDADAFLHRSANEWANWKENSPFLPDAPYTIDVRIETPENDNRKNAIQFLLLHEFGHVLTAKSDFLPDWWIGAQKFKSTEEYDYLCLSWQIAMSGEIIPLLREDFPNRKMISYYASEQSEQRQDGNMIQEIYQALEKTSFPTLYGSTNAYDDFAEGFVTYVHHVLMKKPFEINIKSHQETIMQCADFWSSQRARKKLNFFDHFLRPA
jgi:hypothetical protein